jgi:N-acetylneuraminate synthase
MTSQIMIGGHPLGDDAPCFIVAELGINHNGDLELARRMIAAAHGAGCQMVKLQKRTVERVYSAAELDRPRQSHFGATNRDLKLGLEFDLEQYREIDRCCREHGLLWTASCWDEAALDFIAQFNPPCFKISSACLTNDDLLRRHRAIGRPIMLSTGMSSLDQIDHAVDLLGTRDLILLHCTSSYPAQPEELNLRAIQTLRERYRVPVGYSGHEVGLATTLAAAVLGACLIERHLTLDRAMWGSDQAASVEPHGFARLVRDIRTAAAAMGDGIKRVYESERPSLEKLRRGG